MTTHRFKVFHPRGGHLNYQCKPNFYEYEEICEIDVPELHDVFRMTQNDLNPTYALGGHRSTSVGDIIVDISDGDTYLIEGFGFRQIDQSWLMFRKNSYITYSYLKIFGKHGI